MLAIVVPLVSFLLVVIVGVVLWRRRRRQFDARLQLYSSNMQPENSIISMMVNPAYGGPQEGITSNDYHSTFSNLQQTYSTLSGDEGIPTPTTQDYTTLIRSQNTYSVLFQGSAQEDGAPTHIVCDQNVTAGSGPRWGQYYVSTAPDLPAYAVPQESSGEPVEYAIPGVPDSEPRIYGYTS